MTDPTTPGGPPPEPVAPSGPPAYPPSPPPPSAPDPFAPVPPGEPVPDPTTTYAVPPGAPPPVDPAATAGRSSGGGRKVGVVVVAIVVLALGAVASFLLLGDDERGAATPEEAGEQLVDALNQSDVLAVVDLLPEGERDVLLEVADLAAEFERLGVLGDAFDLDGFNGVDFEIRDPEFETEEVSDSDAGSLTLVSLVGGEASIEVDGEELTGNVGEVIEAIVDESGGDVEADDFADEIDIADVLDDLEDDTEDFDEPFGNPFTIAVIEDDGRFFPSITFTTAELLRADANASGEDIDAPELDDGIEPEGGDSPEEAVQALFDAATALDAEAILAGLDPGEVGAIQVYAPLFSDLGDGDDTGIEIELTDARVEATDRGGSRVVPTGLTVSAELDDLDFEFVMEDECIEFTAESDGDDFELERTCFDEDIDSDIADDVDIPDEIRDLVAAFVPIEGGIVTVERDGQHFVSPTRTLVQSVEGVVDDLDRADIEEGGIVFEAFDGDLDDAFDDFSASIEDAFEGADPDEAVVAVLALAQDLDIDITESLVSAPGIFGGGAFLVGFTVASAFEDFEVTEEVVEDGFDEDLDERVDEEEIVRVPTGPSGPNGELLVGDVVEGVLAADGVATFTAVGAASDGLLFGAQAGDGSDLTITVIDAATGAELAFDDDFNFPDPEVFLFLDEGQVVTVEVRELSGDPAEFLVYYEEL